jgi:DNA protecting protein DprA
MEGTRVTEPADETARLNRYRRLAEQVLLPWPEDRDARTLSPARRTAVRKAIDKLIAEVSTELGQQPGVAIKSGAQRRGKRTVQSDMEALTPTVERAVGVSHEDLALLMMLDSLRGFGPGKFKTVFEHGVPPRALLQDPQLLPLGGKTGQSFRDALVGRTPDDERLAWERAARQIVVAHENDGSILTYEHAQYPKNLFRSNNAVPILYAKGNLDVLTHPLAVACVGSRGVTGPYAEAHYDFARYACQNGWVIVSGFATGADTLGHRAALENEGETIAVMPSGLDRPFPPENRDLWEELLRSGRAAMVSEFPFGTSSNRLNLQKRNKTIVAAALGVFVSQSSVRGGAMNAYRFAVEQRKPVATFLPTESLAETLPDVSGNEVIAHEGKVPSTALPLRFAPKEWKLWLNLLSSSI